MSTKRTPASHPFYQSVYNDFFEKRLAAGEDLDQASENAMKDFEQWAKPPRLEDITFVSKPEWARLEDPW